jgi:REP element-mobilizing transposase RayT
MEVRVSFLCTRVHFIWSTAKRAPQIERAWQPRLHGYLRGILENVKSKPLAVGGISDHVHVYGSLPATLSIAEVASTLKSNSSKWVHEELTKDFGGGGRFRRSFLHFLRSLKCHTMRDMCFCEFFDRAGLSESVGPLGLGVATRSPVALRPPLPYVRALRALVGRSQAMKME